MLRLFALLVILHCGFSFSALASTFIANLQNVGKHHKPVMQLRYRDSLEVLKRIDYLGMRLSKYINRPLYELMLDDLVRAYSGHLLPLHARPGIVVGVYIEIDKTTTLRIEFKLGTDDIEFSDQPNWQRVYRELVEKVLIVNSGGLSRTIQ